MIRVKLLSEPEYRQLSSSMPDDCENQFYDLLRRKGEFTDAESLMLLRHLHGEEAIAGKWYRRTTAEGKDCLPAISPEAMYGLVVIENSRNGRYTPILKAFTDFEVGCRMGETAGGNHENPLVWQAFAKMDMDILLTFRKKDFSFAWEIPIDEEFILENYPMGGVPTEVHVVREYLHEPAQRNGVWYVHNFFYEQKYWWGNDTTEILDLLRREFAWRPPLAKGVFSLQDFESMCRPQEDDCGGWNRVQDEQEEPEQPAWQVVNHMDYLPDAGESRRLLYVIIEEYDDGFVCLRDEVSVKYPNYSEMLYEAMGAAKPNCEVFLMPVDVNECMGCAEDLRKAVCAFRITEGIIETFDAAEGLREFEKTLRRVICRRLKG